MMRMRFVPAGIARLVMPLVVVALLPLAWSGPAHSTGRPSAAGLWQALDDDTKQPTGWFLISDHTGVYDGIIAKMFLKPGEDPNAVCDQCKDDRHDHPWLGLEIIRGMKPENEDKYGGGTILDPRDGKIYKATMKVSPDGQTLIVRGYIGFELLGKNQYWTRLPDSAYTMLDPSINPNPAVNTNPAVNASPAVNQKRPPAPPSAHKSELPQQAPALRGSKQ
jgi:uncharacterized protein (DUF2147 family)